VIDTVGHRPAPLRFVKLLEGEILDGVGIVLIHLTVTHNQKSALNIKLQIKHWLPSLTDSKQSEWKTWLASHATILSNVKIGV
jgi:hypothetical protein